MRSGHTARWGTGHRRNMPGSFSLRLAPRFALRQPKPPSHRIRMSYDPTCGSGGQVRSVPQPNPKYKLMCTRWFPGLTAECSGLAEYSGVDVPDVGSEFARKLIAKRHPAVDVA